MILRLLAIAVVAVAVVSGCKKQVPPTGPTEPTVTAENLDTELDKMEKEIEADIAAEEE